MILADTSVWIEHLNRGDATVRDLLIDGQIVMHPFVLGELALGTMREWNGIMYRLARLPVARAASNSAVLEMIGANNLQGSGIGYVDAHLAAACLLDGNMSLWTHDRRLAAVADRLGVSATAA